MQVNDLVVTGDARIIGNLYANNTSIPGGSSGGGGSGSSLTYSISKSGSTITLRGSDGSTSSVNDDNTTYSLSSLGAAPSNHTHSYNDLNNKPSIPSVGNGTVTVTQNGVNKGSFTMNQSGNTTIALTDTDTNTTYGTASQSSNGLMSAADKKKLDGIASGANNYTYTLPTASSSTLGGVKIGSNITNSSGTISLSKSNVTSALGYTPPTTNTTYSNATTTTAGLMSAADKKSIIYSQVNSGSTNSTSWQTFTVPGNVVGLLILIKGTSNDWNIPMIYPSAYGNSSWIAHYSNYGNINGSIEDWPMNV